MMKDELILIGGGGHCKSCIDVIERAGTFRIVGIVDVPEKLHYKVLGYEVIATDEDLPRLVKDYHFFLITIGQIKSPQQRIAMFHALKGMDALFPTIVSPLAYVSKYAQIGEGSIVMHHVLINAGARIGKNCIVNTKALIEHDAVICDHCHIATGAIINGGVTVEAGTFFGSNAVSGEYVEIGKNCLVGCNAKVIKKLPSGTVMK